MRVDRLLIYKEQITLNTKVTPNLFQKLLSTSDQNN